MKKLITAVLMLAAGAAGAHNFGNIESRKGALHIPVNKSEATSLNWDATTNATPNVPVLKISGKANAVVHVVYGGKISSVFTVEGKQTVLVQHDNYFTLYQGVEGLKVKKDDVVTEGQAIGVVNNGDHLLMFQIWMTDNGKPTTLTPAEWLEK